MTDNEKMIQAITGHLPKLPTKHLRLVLLMIHEFLKHIEVQEEVEA